MLVVEAYHRRTESIFVKLDELQARLALSVVAPPMKGSGKKKSVKYQDLLLYKPKKDGGKSDEEKRREYEDIVKHVRGRSFKLGRGIKSEKTIRQIADEKRQAEREHRR